MGRRIRIDPSSRLPLDPPPAPANDVCLPGAPRTRYVELWARSCYSFLRGASTPAHLIARAVELKHDTLAVTDCDGLYGIVRAHEAALERGLKLVVGCELTIGDKPPFASVVVHVENHTGYQNLCRILTESHHRHPKGKRTRREPGVAKNLYAGVPLDVVCAHAAGLWVLAPAGDTHAVPLGPLVDAFGERVSVAVYRHFDGEDAVRIDTACRASNRFAVAMCATNAVQFAVREHKPILDVLHCIREGVTLDEAGRALGPNAEARLKSSHAMEQLFADTPEWITRSRLIADACHFSVAELREHYRFPCEYVLGETPDDTLRRRTYEGGRNRYGAIPTTVVAQIEKELALIKHLRVAPYFLSVDEIVTMARARDILCQGRGSAANSAVCFCLGVTAVDPTRSTLLFERFLSENRSDPPDIDIDFEHERREEVIQGLYARYGRDRAAMVCEVISYRSKSALRDVGKAFGLSLEQTERLSGLASWWDQIEDIGPERFQGVGIDPSDPRVRHVLKYAREIQGYPRHLSIHVGGFVLSAGPLNEVAPVEPATMKDRTVIPWDKDDIDVLGFFKVDLLGLGMLTAIRKTLELIHAPGDTMIDRLARIPSEDPAVYEALCHADAVGVFQVESRAQMAMLPRLKPREFYDLVIEVAIVRPGPIQGGMVHPYLRRRNGEEEIAMPHPCLKPILERTFGVPLFQEQAMQIAIVGAGYTGADADQLRRDMAAWRRNGRLALHKKKLEDGFRDHGIPEAFAHKLYDQIQGFGEYGFPESHAFSFALLVYVSAWLHLHVPAAFAAALVNSQPMGFYSPNTIFEDARRHGVEVRPPNVTASDWDCTLEQRSDGVPAIRVGLCLVRGLANETGLRIEAARSKAPFSHIEDLAARADLERRDLEALAEAGALEPLLAGRREASWKARAPRSKGLFHGNEQDGPPVQLPALNRFETLSLDYARTGVSVSDHPMRILRPTLGTTCSSRDLLTLPHGTRVSVAGLAISRQRPGTASGIVFMTLEDEFGFANLVLFARTFDRLRQVATSCTLVTAHGQLERQGEVVHVLVDGLDPLQDGGLRSTSRDFH